jgi:hypothetical protein
VFVGDVPALALVVGLELLRLGSELTLNVLELRLDLGRDLLADGFEPHVRVGFAPAQLALGLIEGGAV